MTLTLATQSLVTRRVSFEVALAFRGIALAFLAQPELPVRFETES